MLCSLLVWLLTQATQPLEKSSYFAFVDRDFIFTVEVVRPGVPLLNFVSMTDQDVSLAARNVRLTVDNRRESARLLVVETGDVKQPMSVPSMPIHPRSSFGVRLEGDFGNARQLYGATIRLGGEELKLEPMTNIDFENLVLKINRLNLGSPDFSDDMRVLNLVKMGERSARR